MNFTEFKEMFIRCLAGVEDDLRWFLAFLDRHKFEILLTCGAVALIFNLCCFPTISRILTLVSKSCLYGIFLILINEK